MLNKIHQAFSLSHSSSCQAVVWSISAKCTNLTVFKTYMVIIFAISGLLATGNVCLLTRPLWARKCCYPHSANIDVSTNNAEGKWSLLLVPESPQHCSTQFGQKLNSQVWNVPQIPIGSLRVEQGIKFSAVRSQGSSPTIRPACCFLEFKNWFDYTAKSAMKALHFICSIHAEDEIHLTKQTFSTDLN